MAEPIGCTVQRHKPSDFPAWSLLGGALLLSATAGFVNVVMLQLFHVPVSHMTGAASHLSEEMIGGGWRGLVFTGGVVLAFLGGATVCGLIVGNKSLRPGRRYGIGLMVEGAALGLAAWLAQRGQLAALPAAAFACGLQNALATSYHNLVIRTTHVTGIVTDIGLMLGHLIKRHRIVGFNLVVLVTLLSGFVLGGVAGYAMYDAWGMRAMWLPAAGCWLAGGGYYLWRQRLRIASVD